MLTFATVFAALTSTSIGAFISPVVERAPLELADASFTAVVSTFVALITTLAVFSVPGNAALRRL